MARHNGFNRRHKFAALVLINAVGVVLPRNRAVGWDFDDVQLVNFPELFFLGQRRTSHAGQLAVQTEKVLERNGCQGLGLVRDRDIFLGFNRLMKPFVITPPEHQAAGELVYNNDLAITDDIIHVTLHNATRLDRLVDMVQKRRVFRVRQVLDLEILLGARDALGGHGRGARLLVDKIIGVDVVLLLLGVNLLDTHGGQPCREHIRQLVKIGRRLALARNNQRRARLIDQD